MKLALGCLAAATLIATTACGPRTPDYEKTADTALSSAALDKVNADYDKDAKTKPLPLSQRRLAPSPRARSR